MDERKAMREFARYLEEDEGQGDPDEYFTSAGNCSAVRRCYPVRSRTFWWMMKGSTRTRPPTTRPLSLP